MTGQPKNQKWSAEGYSHNAGFVPVYGREVLEWLDPRKGERILDLGCGDGKLTAEIAETGAEVTGVDASPDLLDAARERGLNVLEMDGEALSFDSEFDAVFSNAALHWMNNPDAVLSGVRRSLVSGGRFVGEMGGHGNVAAIITAVLACLEAIGRDGRPKNPWFFPSVADYSKRLENNGFQVEKVHLIPRPTPLPTGMEGWLETFAGRFLDGLEKDEQKQVLSHAITLLKPSLCDEMGNWTADYVRLRFMAKRL